MRVCMFACLFLCEHLDCVLFFSMVILQNFGGKRAMGSNISMKQATISSKPCWDFQACNIKI